MPSGALPALWELKVSLKLPYNSIKYPKFWHLCILAACVWTWSVQSWNIWNIPLFCLTLSPAASSQQIVCEYWCPRKTEKHDLPPQCSCSSKTHLLKKKSDVQSLWWQCTDYMTHASFHSCWHPHRWWTHALGVDAVTLPVSTCQNATCIAELISISHANVGVISPAPHFAPHDHLSALIPRKAKQKQKNPQKTMKPDCRVYILLQQQQAQTSSQLQHTA